MENLSINRFLPHKQDPLYRPSENPEIWSLVSEDEASCGWLLVSPVQTAGPDSGLDGEGEDPPGERGRRDLDHGLHLGLAHTPPVSCYPRSVADTDHPHHGGRTVGLQPLASRTQRVGRDGVSSHLETVGQEDVSLSYEHIGQGRELSGHLRQHALHQDYRQSQSELHLASPPTDPCLYTSPPPPW